MATVYTPPGTYVSEVVSPSISPLLASPSEVCLVGLTQGFQQRTDTIKLTGTTAIALPGIPTGATLTTVVSVKDALDPTKGAVDGSGYVLTTDYTVQTGAGTVTRAAGGAIADGATVNVTYQYVVANYYDPIRLDSMGAIESMFGPALNTAGNAISCVVSYAAGLAFENAAATVVIQPLFKRATPGDTTTARVQPDATQAAALSSWQDTLVQLRNFQDVNILVPVLGQSATNVSDSVMLNVIQAFQDHIEFMKTQQQYVIGVYGEDSTTLSTNATKATLITHATTLAARYAGDVAEQSVLITPSNFVKALPSLGATIPIGGQYVAAALAGMLAARSVAAPLTRQPISGVQSVNQTRTLADKNDEAAVGLCVVEQKGNNVRFRHAITLDSTATQRRELSVVRAKHFMIESIRDTLETQIIGQVIADGTAPLVVRSAIIGVLEQLRQARDLVDYSDVQARLLALDPTTIEVRFSYRPAFPVNYINIVFSIDMTTGSISDNAQTVA